MRGKVFVVTMYRWGNTESHSYPLGVFDHSLTALSAAQEEMINRANKYEPEIIEFEMNIPKRKKIFRALNGY